MEEINSIKEILKKTSHVVKHHEKIERDTGYKFNLFRVTKIERYEVNTHSAMIAELLNPNGSHGQGNIFLLKFLDCIEEYLRKSEISKSTIDCSHVKVLKEKSFNLGKDRVDILLEFNNFTLLIENKIDAVDSKNQLKRYFDIGGKSKKKFCLLYLTKYGDSASEKSHCGVSYEKISYREDIAEWLGCCIKEVALVPIVREAILQYLNLVRKITGISMTSEFKEEMVSLLLEGNNLKNAQKIADSINNAKGNILYDFFEKVTSVILDKNSKYRVISNIEVENNYTENKCIQWFSGKKKHRGIGVFIDIAVPNTLFHIEVATIALHYGFVKVKKDSDTGNYIILNEDIDCHQKFERRKWDRIQWYSFMYNSDIPSKIDMLKKPDEFIQDILESIIDKKI